jgi:hypothetical protein
MVMFPREPEDKSRYDIRYRAVDSSTRHDPSDPDCGNVHVIHALLSVITPTLIQYPVDIMISTLITILGKTIANARHANFSKASPTDDEVDALVLEAYDVLAEAINSYIDKPLNEHDEPLGGDYYPEERN